MGLGKGMGPMFNVIAIAFLFVLAFLIYQMAVGKGGEGFREGGKQAPKPPPPPPPPPPSAPSCTQPQGCQSGRCTTNGQPGHCY